MQKDIVFKLGGAKDHHYKHITLPNGMRCLLISTEAKTSHAALSVPVGSGCDPDGYAGVAHFLEHMLFQGSKKYPSHTEYKDFIDSRGG